MSGLRATLEALARAGGGRTGAPQAIHVADRFLRLPIITSAQLMPSEGFAWCARVPVIRRGWRVRHDDWPCSFAWPYPTVTNAMAALRLLTMSDRDKDVEILALRHQITVLERQLGVGTRVRFAPEDRAFLVALLATLPREVLRRLRLLVSPDIVLRWHRDLLKRRHAHASCLIAKAGVV
ncbi:hypothetical protein ACFLIM_35655 [Nonomuraea sp. M3C6]|uniref:Uncharacterized protein n=1 Tax=Nonomuraea marmarensis TaxID=3351344 RepID=A0ABW7AMD1_9ACTN